MLEVTSRLIFSEVWPEFARKPVPSLCCHLSQKVQIKQGLERGPGLLLVALQRLRPPL